VRGSERLSGEQSDLQSAVRLDVAMDWWSVPRLEESLEPRSDSLSALRLECLLVFVWGLLLALRLEELLERESDSLSVLWLARRLDYWWESELGLMRAFVRAFELDLQWEALWDCVWAAQSDGLRDASLGTCLDATSGLASD